MKKLFCLIYFSTFAISFGQAYALYTHYFRNDFPNGKIKVNGVQYDVPSDPKFDGGPLGVWKRWIAPDGTQNATALSSQYTNGAHYFSNWEENGAYTTSNLTYSFPSFYNQVYTIEHVAKYTSTFTVTVVGSPYGILVIDGIQYTGSKSKQITEPNVVVASAHNYENNGISFIFTK